jgi:sulfur carrier protein
VVSQLIQTLNLSSQRFAVEINEQIIPRSQHPRHRLEPDDRVEVVTAIGGG